MSKSIDPGKYGLPQRTVVEQIDDETLAIVMDRKSRIIMKDGRKIVDKVNTVHRANPNVKVVLKTTAPVCSKTRKFLDDNGVEIRGSK